MKRILAAMVCLALFCSAAVAETFVVNYTGGDESGGYAMLLRDDGTPLTPPNTYAGIYAVTPDGTPEDQRLYAAEPIDLTGIVDIDVVNVDEEDYASFYRVALLSADGRQLTGFDYYGLSTDSTDLVAFTLPDLTSGLLDRNGVEVLPPRYITVQPNGKGGCLALALNGEAPDLEGRLYPAVYIDPDMREHPLGLELPWSSFGVFVDGICPADSVRKYDDGTIYLDAEGNMLFGRSFDSAYSFEGVLAEVSVDGLSGLIDREGNFIAPPVFDYISHDDTVLGGVFICHNADSFTIYLDQTGEPIMEMGFPEVEDLSVWMDNPGMVRVNADGVVTLYDLDSEPILTFSEDESVFGWWNLCEGIPQRMVRTTGDWPREEMRLIDLNGNPVGDAFQDLNTGVWTGDTGLLIYSAFRIILDEEGDEISDWHSYRRGLCDQDGSIVLPAIYSSLEFLSPDRLWVTCGDRTGMIDTQGRWLYVIEPYTELMD